MNEQISPSQELVNKVINLINESPQEIKKSRQIWKPMIKFALPALIIISVFCFQIIGGNMSKVVNDPDVLGNLELKNNNWFSLAVYASDEMAPVEITRDMKIKMPGNYFHWGMMTLSDGVYTDGRYIVTINSGNDSITLTDDNIYGVDDWEADDWKAFMEEREYFHFVIIGFMDETDETGETAKVNKGGFAFEGENINSVSLESKYGEFSWTGENDKWGEWNWEHDTHIILEGAEISSKWFSWFPTTLQKNLSELPVRNPENYDYRQYLTDTITINVTFDDGEIITQIVELTIDENTGETFAQIIG
jgi:hypothetical protein